MSKLDFTNRTDTTVGALKIEGAAENKRNRASKELFLAIMREVHGDRMPDPDDAMVAHHLTVVLQDVVKDNAGRELEVEVVEEYPAADTLIFDHDVARKIWGYEWAANLTALALEPTETRDALLAKLYYGRKK
jgi:hypothetical protein